MFVRSSRLPVPHAFSAREGGISEGRYSSLNLGYSVGDDVTKVLENRRRFAHALGLDLNDVHTLHQVHGDTVLQAGEKSGEPGLLAPLSGKGDALWTDRPEATVAIKNADCTPLLLVDPDGKRVAAVHSGWRGTELGIAARAVEELVRKGARPSRLQIAIGPSIRACCYEISEELAVRFQQKFGPAVISRPRDKPHLDLVAAVVLTLRQCHIGPEQLDVLPHCTSCEPARFFSFRRDHGVTGQHYSLVQCRF
jgi:YfiH family protein